MEDSQDVPDRDITDLWARGKFWEMFGFSNGDFTTLELAKQYSLLTKAYHDNPKIKQIIDEAFATLCAPLTRQFYEGCRMVMRRISGQMGRATFRDAEHRIWLDLWGWVSKSWEEPPEDLIKALANMYCLPSGTAAIHLPQSRSDEGLKPADLDSVMAASAFAKETTCQSCGRFDHSLRLAAFPYVISILIVSFRRASEAGVFCYQCRCAKSIKWAVVSLLFGWWSIWGFFWNIGALVDNYRGGKVLWEYNDPLVARLAWAHMALGKIAEAKAALADLSKHSFNKEALQLKSELDSRYPEVAPARTGVFRPGYLSLVLGVLAVFVIAGFAMFGGSSPSSSPTPTPLTQPSDSYVQWDDNSGWTTASTITATGSVRNTHHSWSMTSVEIEVEVLDRYNQVIQTLVVPVSPSTIPPGGIGRYSQSISAPSAAEDGRVGIEWIWTPPR